MVKAKLTQREDKTWTVHTIHGKAHFENAADAHSYLRLLRKVDEYGRLHEMQLLGPLSDEQSIAYFNRFIAGDRNANPQ